MASHCTFIFNCVVVWLAMVFGSCSSDSLRVQEHLKRLNKPATSTIKSPDGDLIDCIPISQQPAFDHPLLKDHKIQMQPDSIVETPLRKVVAVQEGQKEGKRRGWFARWRFSNKPPTKASSGHQLWHRVGSSCPKGTIPIRRTRASDLLRSKSQMHNYGRKFHHPPKPPVLPAASFNATEHEHAIGYVQGGKYYGAQAIINVWNPRVQATNEFSLAQIWVLGGSFNDSSLNSIEAGWQSDYYNTTGCYNLLCSGFVQVSNQIAMGATITPISSYAGEQYDITLLIWKDIKQGNWWMQFGNKYILGYWPATLFTWLSESASMIEWGGEVLNLQPGGEHTSTQMGSGHFPSEGFGKSSYVSHLLTVDENNNLTSAGDVIAFAERPTCYDVEVGSSSDLGDYFYFGGPGRNQNCL